EKRSRRLKERTVRIPPPRKWLVPEHRGAARAPAGRPKARACCRGCWRRKGNTDPLPRDGRSSRTSVAAAERWSRRRRTANRQDLRAATRAKRPDWIRLAASTTQG